MCLFVVHKMFKDKTSGAIEVGETPVGTARAEAVPTESEPISIVERVWNLRCSFSQVSQSKHHDAYERSTKSTSPLEVFLVISRLICQFHFTKMSI